MGVGWSSTPIKTNYDPCADLSFALIATDESSDLRPHQVVLFHLGEHLGTTSDCAAKLQSIEASSGTHVSVRYAWATGSGTETSSAVEYRWNANSSKVEMTGRIPLDAISAEICHTWPPIQ
ncbi:Putative lipoprotein LprE [Pseudoclavibacter triregionum]|nr:Putative lipoprotein LprE [Pseudoclavibacter triregionum]